MVRVIQGRSRDVKRRGGDGDSDITSAGGRDTGDCPASGGIAQYGTQVYACGQEAAVREACGPGIQAGPLQAVHTGAGGGGLSAMDPGAGDGAGASRHGVCRQPSAAAVLYGGDAACDKGRPGGTV